MSTRQLIDIELQPVTGSRFQPTGFPDIGPALFQRPLREDRGVRWVDALLLESAQSMANHLEAVGWDRAEQRPVEALAGLPYVRVVAADDGRYLTSSRTEAHRLASAFVKDAALDGVEMREVLKGRLGLHDDTPLAPREISRAVFQLDPLCLVHGVFFADAAWPGQPKIARAVTGFIEALDVRPAISGGVKRDDVRHAIAEGSAGAKEGYGSIPYHRTEYTAASIVASLSIDLAQIASYGLGEPASALLAAIARWEIRALLDGGLRLRTACDLATLGGPLSDRDGVPLPEMPEAEGELRRLIGESRDLLGDGSPTEVVWSPRQARSTAREAPGGDEGT